MGKAKVAAGEALWGETDMKHEAATSERKLETAMQRAKRRPTVSGWAAVVVILFVGSIMALAGWGSGLGSCLRGWYA